MKILFLFIFLSAIVCNPSFARKTGCEGDCENGIGTWTYTDQTIYVGDWLDGLKHGKGKETWPNGYIYTGGFSDSEWKGQGTLIFPDGAQYTGEWLNDNLNGKGIFTWANGDIYVGEFLDSNRHGQGTRTNADGTIMKGIWKEGELVEPN